jgi:hypothetical protein
MLLFTALIRNVYVKELGRDLLRAIPNNFTCQYSLLEEKLVPTLV